MIVLATARAFLDTFSGAQAPDDPLLVAALAKRGVEAKVVAWDDPSYDWSQPEMVIVRSTWDYYLHYPRFLDWIDHVASVTRLMNPARCLRWNTHKTYLRELQAAGIPAIPTAWITRNESVEFASLMVERGWQQVVVKPVVGANAYGTLLVNDSEHDVTMGHMHLMHSLTERDMMVQPYMPSVHRSGEISHVFLDGKWNHAFRKWPFQPRQPHEVLIEGSIQPPESEVAFAQQVYHVVEQKVGTSLLFGRVDVVMDAQNQPVVMECEVTEPMLHLEYANAATILADAVMARVAPAQSRVAVML